jgi:cytochrome c oxidase subunit 3
VIADMTQEHQDDPRAHMGLPLPNGKLAIWLFLVTEIMFFTALIGTYMLIRNGSPSHVVEVKNPETGAVEKREATWPKPHDVHLVEWIGAGNTFVLIVSSLTVVLAHYYLSKNDARKATMYIGVTLALGAVFLGVKAYEYHAKFAHDILPGRIGEALPGMDLTTERQLHPSQLLYVQRVREQLDHIIENPESAGLSKSDPLYRECDNLRKQMDDQFAEATKTHTRALSPAEVGGRVKEILHQAEEEGKSLHLSPTIPHGNMWASCYFAMTGFHALHVFGGLVVLFIILMMGVRGRLGVHHENMLELTGLYWHFVDIVWIFLFPLLYLV